MTKQKHDANELRLKIFARDKYICKNCGEPISSGIPQLAHRIRATKGNIRKYGKPVIYHPDNMLSVCSVDCNNALQLGLGTLKERDLAVEIGVKIAKEKE